MFRSRMTLGRSTAAFIIIVLHIIIMMYLDRLIGRSSKVVVRDLVTYMVNVADHKALQLPHITPESRYPIAGYVIVSPDMPSVEVSTEASSQKGLEIDWGAAASSAAREYVKQHPEQAKPLKPDASSSIFGSDAPTPENVRQQGGKIVQWITSTCYLTIRDGELDSGPPYNGARIQKTCILPTSNGHMLDQLKPEYLKKPVEDICPKDAAGCDHKK